MYRLLLITASSPDIRRVRRARVLSFQQITMPYLAAFAPDNWEVIHTDEAVTPVDVSMEVDLVGITFHTPSAFHVYDLATQFRKRGIPVVLGGPHVTLMPDEAQQYSDADTVQTFHPHWKMRLWHGKNYFIGVIPLQGDCLPRGAAIMDVISVR